MDVSISHRGAERLTSWTNSLARLDQAKGRVVVTEFRKFAGVKVEGRGRVSEVACLQLAHLSLPFHAHSNLSKMQSLSYREQSLLRR